MNKRQFTGFMFLLCTCTAFAQQMGVEKDSIGHAISLPPEQEQPLNMDKGGFILPDMNITPNDREPTTRTDSMTLHMPPPEFMDTPWSIPELGISLGPFSRDCNRSDTFEIDANSYLSTHSLYNTHPTVETHIRVGTIYTYAPNERREFSSGLFNAKYTMPPFQHGVGNDFGFNDSAACWINRFLRIRASDKYSVNGEQNASQRYFTPIHPQSGYSMMLEIKFNGYIELHGGMERPYNSMKRKWETAPIVYPAVKLKGQIFFWEDITEADSRVKIIYLCGKPTFMKVRKLILFLSLILSVGFASAQSEVPSGSIRHASSTNIKESGSFLLDMGLVNVATPELPKFSLDTPNMTKDYNQSFRLNADITYSQGPTDSFSSSSYSGFVGFGYGYGWGLSLSPQFMQMGPFKPKNGVRINTYGDYNRDGWQVSNCSAIPQERNNFRGAFKLESANGNFGIRIEVQ